METKLTRPTSSQINFLGNAHAIRPTENAQYVFSTISRKRYVLESMERAVEICNALAKDPDNQFLLPYNQTGMCLQARLPDLTDFMLVASACSGMHCPKFNSEVVAPVPDGYYSAFGFDQSLCDEGYFCYRGQKAQCPIGFQCKGKGNVFPTACVVDQSKDTSCSVAGLAMPEICPDGTICAAPMLPPIPAPPGFKETPSVKGRSPRGLEKCGPGEWCGFSRRLVQGAERQGKIGRAREHREEENQPNSPPLQLQQLQC